MSLFPIVLGNSISSANRKHVPIAAAHNEHYVMTISIEVGLSVNTQKVSTFEATKGCRAAESHGFIYISGNVTVMALPLSLPLCLCLCVYHIQIIRFTCAAVVIRFYFLIWTKLYKEIRIDSSITQFSDAPLAFGKLSHLTTTRLDSRCVHILSGC